MLVYEDCWPAQTRYFHPVSKFWSFPMMNLHLHLVIQYCTKIQFPLTICWGSSGNCPFTRWVTLHIVYCWRSELSGFVLLVHTQEQYDRHLLFKAGIITILNLLCNSFINHVFSSCLHVLGKSYLHGITILPKRSVILLYSWCSVSTQNVNNFFFHPSRMLLS